MFDVSMLCMYTFVCVCALPCRVNIEGCESVRVREKFVPHRIGALWEISEWTDTKNLNPEGIIAPQTRESLEYEKAKFGTRTVPKPQTTNWTETRG